VGQVTFFNSAYISRKNLNRIFLEAGCVISLFHLAVQSISSTPRAEFFKLQTIWIVPLILCRRVCSFLAISASYEYSCSGYALFGHIYSPTLVITPDPTVLPPSRIAKCRPSSSAIGTISLADMLAWSPGITISMPFGSSIEPVISVVLI